MINIGMSMMNRMTTVSFLALLLLASQSAMSQPPRGEGPRAVERIEQLKKVRLIEALDMAEEESIRFFARMNEHEKTKKELISEKMAVLDDLERMVGSGAGDDEYQRLFPEIRLIDEKIAEEDQRFFSSLDDILSEEQRAKFVLFGRQFQEELRDALRTLHRRRDP